MPALDSSVIDARLHAFEREMESSREADLSAFLPPPGDPSRSKTICELARVDLELRWARGEQPELDGYLQRYPELTDPAYLAAVAYEDYRQRVMSGNKPARDDYARRYQVDVSEWPGPEATTTPLALKTELASSTGNRRALSADDPTRKFDLRGSSPCEVGVVGISSRTRDCELSKMPELGESFLGFRLVRELGRGAFGRVYLAEQASLANRPVAVKFTTGLATESQALARLQHTNVVPIYSTHHGDKFHALVMPYFGGTTLTSVIAQQQGAGAKQNGGAIVEAIRNGRNTAAAENEPVPPSLDWLGNATFVDAVLWIGERISDALAHAHERGIIHRDIKPANILLADDGQPMLLDFNLAADTSEQAADRARVGGTLPYMAPEVLQALSAGKPVAADARTDIYSLGIVLYQLLTGKMPFPLHVGKSSIVLSKMCEDRARSTPRLRPDFADVSPSTEAIIRKCLASKPAERYQSAAALRDDLAHQRLDRPLKNVREPSRRERLRKWVRRHPRLTSPAATALYAAALILAVSVVAARQSLAARAERQDAERAAAYRNYEEFLSLSESVKVAAGSRTGSNDVLRLGNEALDRFNATQPGWEDDPAFTRLPQAERERLRPEIGEVAFLTARAASVNRRDAELAVRLNALAESTLNPGDRVAVEAQRAQLLGNDFDVAKFSDGGRGTFLRACDLAASGRHVEALPLASAVVSRNPDDFGGWFLKARCHDVLGQYEDARAAYATCAALRPLSAQTFAARGDLAFRNGKDLDQARADLDRALKLDPDRVDARLTRALVLRRLNRPKEALKDLDYLVADPKAPTRVYFVRATVRDAAGDKAGAAADRTEGMKREPCDPPSFVTRGLARAAKQPELALADFQVAEQLDPNYPEAMINQSWILGEKLNRTAEALAAADRLLKLYPDNQNARGGRAVYLARLGRHEEAVAEARKLLAAAVHPSAYYQAASVFGIVAKTDSAMKAEGVRLVATALRRGFGHDYLLDDHDLDALRGDEKFRALAEAVRIMAEFGTK